mmetsp:Transcript_14127/g.29757  ORF Transcript_14127/g.29757 Transcript_14127/m.29757 type:complete len:104 (-) Transcript_14127:244-555(-)
MKNEVVSFRDTRGTADKKLNDLITGGFFYFSISCVPILSEAWPLCLLIFNICMIRSKSKCILEGICVKGCSARLIVTEFPHHGVKGIMKTFDAIEVKSLFVVS